MSAIIPIKKAEIIPLKKAEDIRTFLSFIDKEAICCNISHHIQYLEFLYRIKKRHQPKLTSLSLLNKTIIIEYFVVIEAIIDCLLCQLRVQVNGKTVAIEIDKLTPADRLFKLAKRYKIIDADTHSRIGDLKETRNKIHIKRTRRRQKLEHEEYSDELLKEREKIFKSFMVYLFEKHNIGHSDFLWPWNV
jgi:hypothetical protein